MTLQACTCSIILLRSLRLLSIVARGPLAQLQLPCSVATKGKLEEAQAEHASLLPVDLVGLLAEFELGFCRVLIAVHL